MLPLKAFESLEDAKNFEEFPLIYSRNSIAYEGNSALLQANQPSMLGSVVGEWGYGSYESETNLLLAEVANASSLTNIGMYGSADGINESKELISGGTIGSNIAKVNSNYDGVQDLALSIQPFSANRINVVGGQPYTLVVRTSASHAVSGRLAINWYQDSTYVSRSSIDFTQTTDFKIRTLTATAPEDANNCYAEIYIYNVPQGAYILYDWGTFINKPYPLPYITGGTTRQADNLYIAKNEVMKFLDLNGACIEVLINVNDAFKNNSAGRFLISMRGAGDKNQLALYKNKSGQFGLALSNNTQNSISYVDPTLTNGLGVLTGNYSKNQQSTMYNFVEGTPSSTVYVPESYPSELKIGLHQTGTGAINTSQKWLVFSKPRTLEDRLKRQKEAKANGYFKIDKKVTAVVPLETNLKGYRRVKV